MSNHAGYRNKEPLTGRRGPVRIPTKPARHSNMKPATRTDLKPAMVPI
jgi:hypothetical protein